MRREAEAEQARYQKMLEQRSVDQDAIDRQRQAEMDRRIRELNVMPPAPSAAAQPLSTSCNNTVHFNSPPPSSPSPGPSSQLDNTGSDIGTPSSASTPRHPTQHRTPRRAAQRGAEGSNTSITLAELHKTHNYYKAMAEKYVRKISRKDTKYQNNYPPCRPEEVRMYENTIRPNNLRIKEDFEAERDRIGAIIDRHYTTQRRPEMETGDSSTDSGWSD